DSRKSFDDDEVKLALNGLLNQSDMYAMMHIRDPHLRENFRDEYLFLARCMKRDYDNGILYKDRIVKLARQERQSLIEQAYEITKYTAGLVAGIGQTSAGFGMCITSSVFSIAGASWCGSMGATMMAHGTNNIYEASYNITGNIVQNWKGAYTGDYGDADGYVRKTYQRIAKEKGFGANEGNLAYSGVDIATSAYGLLKSDPKSVGGWAEAEKVTQFKLYYYFSKDLERGWRTMSKGALAAEIGADYYTIKGSIDLYGDDK
ncbi:DUF4225 domain-containing protein, partial [Vibrio parahaemolyticus]|nr:DUF4225 domain-containing protein [Vibrio parahaemolyticus]MDG3419729.1 DUF4225 domain-containing protein [Vibrio parahaemolyticus]